MVLKSFYIKLMSVILIVGLGIIAYSNTFQNSFHFDDHSFINDNDAIKDISNLQNIWNFLPCRFVYYFSLALNEHFGKEDVFGYHVVNVSIHLIAAILAWWFTLLILSTPLFKGPKPPKEKNKPKDKVKAVLQIPEDPIVKDADWIALMVGLVFVSHPIQIQAVTYIMQRAAAMGTMFYLAALCLYVKSRLAKRGIFYYIAALIATVLAMFTKEITITLPLMIVFLEFCFFKMGKTMNWKSITPFLLMAFIIPATMFLTRSNNAISSREMQHALQGSAEISSTNYLLTQFRVVVTYLRLLVVPIHQNVDYDYPVSQSLFEFPTLISFFFIAGILMAAWRLFAKYRLLTFAIGWFFIALIPESSIFPIQDVIFEHRLYLPMIGYCLFLVGGLYYLVGKRSFPTMMIAVTLIVGCNSFLTYQRNKVWKNELTLWNDAVQKSPDKARPYNQRGLALYFAGQYNEAMLDFNRAIAIDPKIEEAYNNRGLIYSKRGDLNQALADYSKAIELNPALIKAYDNRGGIENKLNEYDQAIADYTKAIEMNPNLAEAYCGRGEALADQHHFSQAIADYNKAIELDPNSVEAYNNLANAYATQGDFRDAIDNFNRAISLDPHHEEAFSNRGLAEAQEGQYPKAVADFDRAIEINPKYKDAYDKRGIIEARQGNALDAIADFTRALALDPKDAEVYNNRGIIDGQTHHISQAIADFTRAIEVNPQFVQSYSNRAISYFQLKEFAKAWDDVKRCESLGAAMSPRFIHDLKQASAE